jgi:hypothetical protein
MIISSSGDTNHPRAPHYISYFARFRPWKPKSIPFSWRTFMRRLVLNSQNSLEYATTKALKTHERWTSTNSYAKAPFVNIKPLPSNAESFPTSHHRIDQVTRPPGPWLFHLPHLPHLRHYLPKIKPQPHYQRTNLRVPAATQTINRNLLI